MKAINCTLFLGMLLGAGMLAMTQANGSQESDPTSAEAWSAGNTSGAGNFFSYCMPCHGAEGKGDGMLAESLDVKPRNLSDAKLMSSKPDKHLFKVIKEGGSAVGLTENMTPFMNQLSDEEIGNIIGYIREEICQCDFEAN
ncbi:MAG: cytochrome c [Alphaproteobacteria bacterium]|jgi:mono/diheme cytochrome c family protein|nr:cytochrome c [Alphaproteobacteria bacterium]|tara:strand:+ start:330 stop:752 length:423 start_codon:yes stop_codon:yes gene_type:complete